MAQEFTVILPDIGEGVVEGEVIEWLKKPGDAVRKDEAIVVVMTDKATVELPAPKAGELSKCYYKAGEIAKVGKPLYSIAVADTEELSKAEAVPQPKREEPKAAAVPEEKPCPAIVHTGRSLALPSTRKIAKELGINLDSVKGSGKDGRVLLEDLHFDAEPGAEPREEDIIEPITGIRRLMMKKMAEAKRTIPHFSYFERVEVSRLIQLRKKISVDADKEGIHLTYMPFFIKALSLTLTKFPKVNSSVDAQNAKLHLHPYHHIGIAMATDQGLIVPVLKHVEKLNLSEVIHAYEELKKKTASHSLDPKDMREGTITISNYGVLGGDGIWATPIIQPPETAILAVAKIAQMPVAVNGEVAVKNMAHLSWSFDHRIIDGHLAAQVSHYFAQLLHNPASLL